MMELIEFICAECQRHMVNLMDAAQTSPRTCLACRAMPGWFHNPEMRKAFHMTDAEVPVKH